MNNLINYTHFESVEMRAGTIINAEINKKAIKPAYILTIDFGEVGIKRSSAQITQHYSVESLIDKQIIAVMNFPHKLIAGIKSEVLVLGCVGEQGTILLQPDKSVPNGARVA